MILQKIEEVQIWEWCEAKTYSKGAEPLFLKNKYNKLTCGNSTYPYTFKHSILCKGTLVSIFLSNLSFEVLIIS